MSGWRVEDRRTDAARHASPIRASRAPRQGRLHRDRRFRPVRGPAPSASRDARSEATPALDRGASSPTAARRDSFAPLAHGSGGAALPPKRAPWRGLLCPAPLVSTGCPPGIARRGWWWAGARARLGRWSPCLSAAPRPPPSRPEARTVAWAARRTRIGKRGRAARQGREGACSSASTSPRTASMSTSGRRARRSRSRAPGCHRQPGPGPRLRARRGAPRRGRPAGRRVDRALRRAGAPRTPARRVRTGPSAGRAGRPPPPDRRDDRRGEQPPPGPRPRGAARHRAHLGRVAGRADRTRPGGRRPGPRLARLARRRGPAHLGARRRADHPPAP